MYGLLRKLFSNFREFIEDKGGCYRDYMNNYPSIHIASLDTSRSDEWVYTVLQCTQSSLFRVNITLLTYLSI